MAEMTISQMEAMIESGKRRLAKEEAAIEAVEDRWSRDFGTTDRDAIIARADDIEAETALLVKERDGNLDKARNLLATVEG